jgi:hypothetical protein
LRQYPWAAKDVATGVINMNVMKVLGAALLFSAVTPVTGCTIDATSGADNGQDEPVEVAREALNGLMITTWGGVSNADSSAFADGTPNTHDLGVGTGWQCWLAGVGGRFANFGAAWILTGQPIGLQPSSHLFLVVQPSAGAAGVVTAVCVPSTPVGGGPFVNNGQPNPAVELTSGNANDWCALDVFWLAGSGTFSALSTNNSDASDPQIISGNPTWTLKGSPISGLASASCAQASLTGRWFYGIQGPSTGTASFPLLQNDRKTPLPSGTACFLTNLRGSFTSNDYSDGVFLSISNTGVWTLAASNAKSATVMCVVTRPRGA